MSSVGQRYAQALMETCGPERSAAVLGDLATFGRWMAEVPALRPTLENPAVPAETKSKLVAELVAQGGLGVEVGRLLDVVVAHRRLRQWGEIEASLRRLCDAALGVARAGVTTARPLSSSEREAFGARLREALGREVVLETREDAGLIAGVVVRVGSTVYDGSVAGTLRALRAALEKR